MIQNEVLNLIFAVCFGILLGAIYFVGLLITVQKGLRSRFSAVWFVASFLIRTGIVLGGFYVIASGSWKSLFASVLGFVIARLLVTHISEKHFRPAGGNHAA